MDDDLDILIRFYEEEKLRVETSIQEYIQDWLYKHASFQARGLHIVIQKLYALNKLNDPFYDERMFLEGQKKQYNKYLENEKGDYMKAYYERKLHEITLKENSVNRQFITPSIPGQVIDDAIYDVIESKINSFKFYISKKENLYLEVSLATKGMLKISLTPAYLYTNKYILNSVEKKSLRGLGFKFNVKEQSYACLHNLEKFTNTNILKTFLARVFFDIFPFRFDNMTTLEVI